MRYRIFERKTLDHYNNIEEKYIVKRQYLGFMYLSCLRDKPFLMFILSIGCFFALISIFGLYHNANGAVVFIFLSLFFYGVSLAYYLTNKLSFGTLEKAKAFIKEKIKKQEFIESKNKMTALVDYEIKKGELVFEKHIKLQEES